MVGICGTPEAKRFFTTQHFALKQTQNNRTEIHGDVFEIAETIRWKSVRKKFYDSKIFLELKKTMF